ncbi:MAG TPA: LuxR C-terminal-related transcriptional regulator, partial [Chloroflexota bacterium]|nr:LuxR C-terminal-related transcriptional regulator [Chloroflexota bacterium]
ARGEAHLAVEEARHFPTYEEAWGAGPGVGVYEWRWRAAAAHAAIGDEEGARTIAGEQRSLAECFGSARALGIALRTCALLEAGPERIEMLRAALPHLPADRSALERTRTLVEFGAALRRCGHRADAREPLQEALELGRRCGALRLAMQAHTELRAAGGHPRLPLRTGLEALTASEQRVADMAASGLTNKEAAQGLFVTVKTIEMHLSNVYRKLGIDSRAQLREALALPSSASRC